MIIRIVSVDFEDQNTAVINVHCTAPNYIREFVLEFDPMVLCEQGVNPCVLRAVRDMVFYDNFLRSYVGAEYTLDDIHITHMKAYAS